MDYVYTLQRYKGYLNAISSRKQTRQTDQEISWAARLRAFQTPDFVDLMEHPSIPEHARASVSKDMFEMYVKTLGFEKAYKICKICLEKPKLTLRVNTLKTNRTKLMHTFTKENGYQVVPCKFSPNGLRFVRHPHDSLYQHAEFKRGHFEIQDEASQLVAMRVDVRPGQTVLDYCGGSGGKSLAFAPFMHNTGQIYLHDIRKAVLMQAKQRFKRAGVQNY